MDDAGVAGPGHGTADLPGDLRLAVLAAIRDDRAFSRVIPYPTDDYLRLLTTFSPHRMLPRDQLHALLDGVSPVVDARGGVLRQRVDTALFVARRTGVAAPVAY